MKIESHFPWEQEPLRIPTTDQAPRNPSEDDEIERAKERQRQKDLRDTEPTTEI